MVLLIVAGFCGAAIEHLSLVLGYLRLDKCDFTLSQPVSFEELRVGPLLVQRQIRHKRIHVARRVLRGFAKRD